MDDVQSGQKFISKVEAARGLCASYVVLAHLIQRTGLRNEYYQPHPLLIDLSSGFAYEAVLFFFVLSGFSIHYASMTRPLGSGSGLCHYYYLRFRRIYPIFCIAVVLTFGLSFLGQWVGMAPDKDGPALLRWVQTLLFVTDREDIKGYLAPVPFMNVPLWSLSYEVLYYLVYPAYWLVSRRRSASEALLLGISISILTGVWARAYGPNHLTNVFQLYGIWCMGAFAAEVRLRSQQLGISRPTYLVIAYILLQSIWVLREAAYGVVYDWLWGAFFFWLVVYYVSPASAQYLDRKGRAAVIGAVVLGMIFIVTVSLQIELSRNMPYFYAKILVTGAIFLLIAWRERSISLNAIYRQTMGRFLALGSISYALYVIHYPILTFCVGLLVFFGFGTYYAVLTVPLIMGCAYLLERVFQPRVCAILDRGFYAVYPQFQTKRPQAGRA